MFIIEECKFRFEKRGIETDKKVKEYLESKFRHEKLLCIASTGNSFIYIDFNLFCKASVAEQTKALENIKSGT